MNKISLTNDAELRVLFEQNYGVREASRRLGLHRDTVMRRFRAYRAEKPLTAEKMIRVALSEARKDGYNEGWNAAVKSITRSTIGRPRRS